MPRRNRKQPEKVRFEVVVAHDGMGRGRIVERAVTPRLEALEKAGYLHILVPQPVREPEPEPTPPPAAPRTRTTRTSSRSSTADAQTADQPAEGSGSGDDSQG